MERDQGLAASDESDKDARQPEVESLNGDSVSSLVRDSEDGRASVPMDRSPITSPFRSGPHAKDGGERFLTVEKSGGEAGSSCPQLNTEGLQAKPQKRKGGSELVSKSSLRTEDNYSQSSSERGNTRVKGMAARKGSVELEVSRPVGGGQTLPAHPVVAHVASDPLRVVESSGDTVKIGSGRMGGGSCVEESEVDKESDAREGSPVSHKYSSSINVVC